MPSPLKVIEFYSGIGGMHFALKEAGLNVGDVDVVAAFDINTVANAVYSHNFPDVRVHGCLIESVPQTTFERMGADIWTMSPPCQPFTRTGKQQASADPRTKSFLALMELLTTLEHKPRYILMENVKGFEASDTRGQFLSALTTSGYQYQEYLISPDMLGIPNSRLRYYLIASRTPLPTPPTGSILTAPPPTASLAEPVPAGTGDCGVVKRRRVVIGKCDYVSATIGEYLDATVDADEAKARPYRLDAKTVCRLTRVLDIVTPDSTRSMCFTKGYGMYAEFLKGEMVQLYVDHTNNLLKANEDDKPPMYSQFDAGYMCK